MLGASDTAEQASMRVLIELPAGEVVPGDRMRDHGLLRRVAGIEASVREGAVVVVFEQAAGCDARLHVPLFQMVSVWRVRGGQ